MRTKRARAALLCGALLLFLFRPCAAEAPQRGADAAWRPLLIYYSLTGRTGIVAATIGGRLGCEVLALTSLRKRTGLWKVNCVFDQLFDRDDELGPVAVDAARYNPLIIAGPIWIHRLASPLRTFLKQRNLAGRDVYVIVTHQGNYGDKDEQAVRRHLAGRGMRLKGYGAVLTRGKTEADIRNAAKSFAERYFSQMEKTTATNN